VHALRCDGHHQMSDLGSGSEPVHSGSTCWFSAASPAAACRRGRKGAPTRWRRLDTDNDGTMAEAKKAAGALLDRDRDGTLDLRELRGRVDAKEFAAADRDKDGTLTKDEYFTIVEKRKALQGRRRPQNCAPRRAARCCACWCSRAHSGSDEPGCVQILALAHILFRKTGVHFSGICARPHGSYGLKVDSDVSSGIKRRMRIRGNNAGRVVFFDDQRSDAPCRKVRAPDDRRSHPPAPATEIRVTRR
jgi:EF hand domain-containing protein